MTTAYKEWLRRIVQPIPYELTGRALLAAHPVTDALVPSVWDCADTGGLTVREALDVLHGHDRCGPRCEIAKTARRVRARVIDAPTVRTAAHR